MSLILGAVDASLSSIADSGGLVARGEGTAAPNANPAPPPDAEGRLNPPRPAVEGVAGKPDKPDTEEGGTGKAGAPLLNSAQRGHLRFVSVRSYGEGAQVFQVARRRKKGDDASKGQSAHVTITLSHILMWPICPQ